MNQQNEHYTSLRSRANEAGDAMARAFDESHKAYAGGDGARAKQLSEEGKRHKAEMERLNKEASEWIFRGRCMRPFGSCFHADGSAQRTTRCVLLTWVYAM